MGEKKGFHFLKTRREVRPGDDLFLLRPFSKGGERGRVISLFPCTGS